jgi:putative transposase
MKLIAAMGALLSHEIIVGATPSSRLNIPTPAHGKNLRKGRYSSHNQIYLITTVTQNRQPVFADFYKGRQLIKVLQNERHAETLAFVVMPDHLHWLMVLGEQRQLAMVVQGVKSISSRIIGSPLWQAGYHDHALRAEDDLQATARYIVANPLRAGLVERIGDYPHWDAVWL